MPKLTQEFATLTRLVAVACVCFLSASSTGCITFSAKAIPAYRLPHQFEAPTKCNLNPINFAMLTKKPAEHVVGPGDTLAITVQGVIPAESEAIPPIISSQTSLGREYYPPLGAIHGPAVGLPVNVQANGVIQLPLVPAINVEGMNLTDAAEEIRSMYVTEGIALEGKDQVNVVLIRSRVNRIMVFREDASLESANFIRKGESIIHKRGSGAVIDLPVGESDLLHALATTGGLPGVDAYNEVWILRRGMMHQEVGEALENLVEEGEGTAETMAELATHVDAVRIPLKLCPGEPIPFAISDVELQEGDVVYVEPRRDEYFYTGGLLPGRQIQLPRDEDLDVLEAIALAEGSVGGLGGTSSVAVLRAGAGVGNIIPPTRVLVIRKLPNGQQIQIRVDLNRTRENPHERIRIMNGDYIMMFYKPSEIAGNAALNFFNFNYQIQ